MSEYTLEQLIAQNPVIDYFVQLTKIPRPSFGERPVSDFIKQWAEAQGLTVAQDERHNLLIKKGASAGYAQTAAVMLQAHLDMVCEKAPHDTHNFNTDPIPVQLQGDLLTTENRTTLGADNGIGVAMAMALLADDTATHPPLHVLFTTAEEEDMSGALLASPEWFQASTIINLDNNTEQQIIVGSCGGTGVRWELPLEREALDNNRRVVRITISGLIGGHSGEDIHRGRAHANDLMAQCLNDLVAQCDADILSLSGGNFRLAIPREASAVVAVAPQDIPVLEELVVTYQTQWRERFEQEPALAVTAVVTDEQQDKLSRTTRDRVLQALNLSPNGINDMLGTLNVVESSCNLGEIHITNDTLTLVTEIRANFPTSQAAILARIHQLSAILGGQVTSFAGYPSWTYRQHSPLRDLAIQVYQDLYQETLTPLVIHAGLECGCFSPKVPHMDAIAIGPNIWDLHSPQERVSVSSVNRVYTFLKQLLSQLNT